MGTLSSPSLDPTAFWACHRLALAELPPHRLRALLKSAGGDPIEALRRTDGLTEKQRKRLSDAQSIAISPRIEAAAERITAVLSDDSRYPAGLRPLDDAPPILFVRGSLPELPTAQCVAIVGSRRSTSYGKGQTARFTQAFVESGLTVISGGAAGIDTAAHKATLGSGGVTVAVVACGLDTVYPAENRGLFEQIIAGGGAILTEFALGVTPEPWRFPARNRIIAGIAALTLVIESPENSGALITARNAAEYGREVFAVPGPVDTGRSRGGHLLVRDGAGIADSPEDVLELFSATPLAVTLPPQQATLPLVPELPPDEAAFFAQLDSTPRHLDEIAEAAGVLTAQAMVAATLLEMKGLIQRRAGNLFIRA